MGYFLNPVALRTQLSSSMTFRELVQRVRSTLVGAQANSEARACPASTPPADSPFSVVMLVTSVGTRPAAQHCLHDKNKARGKGSSWHAGPAVNSAGVGGV